MNIYIENEYDREIDGAMIAKRYILLDRGCVL